MVGRGPHDGQPQGDIHAAGKIQGLNWDQGLIMVHAQSCVIAGARFWVKQRICGMGSGDGQPGVLQLATQGVIWSISSSANLTAFAGMWIEPGDADARFCNAKIMAQGLMQDVSGAVKQLFGDRLRHIADWDMNGERDDRKRRASQHHHNLLNIAEMRQKFRMSGKLKPSPVLQNRLMNGRSA